MFKKATKAVKCEKAVLQITLKEDKHQYVIKTVTFSEQYLIDAIIEKAAREGIVIADDAKGIWWNLETRMYDRQKTADITWKEPIK